MAGAKRRSPVVGPLLTFAIMVGSVVAVAAIAHFVDARQKTSEQAATTSVASESVQQVNRQ